MLRCRLLCDTHTPNHHHTHTHTQDAKKRFDEDEDLKRRAHEEVVKLLAGDAMNISLWERIVQASKDMFDQVYTRLGVDPYVPRGGSAPAPGLTRATAAWRCLASPSTTR